MKSTASPQQSSVPWAAGKERGRPTGIYDGRGLAAGLPGAQLSS